jgi:EAL domain-containing protein (putative c-di-GMP-specific phosphodiesterase class I)
LVAVAGILRNLASESDAVVYRDCADMFAVHIQGSTNRQAEAFAQATLQALHQFTPKLGESATGAQITGSIGIAMYPSHGQEIATLLDNVEHALNDAKSNGGNCAVSYNPASPDVDSMNRCEDWKRELRDAINEDRLVLYAQSMTSLTHSAGTNKEIFARMVGRNGEIIEPRQFLGAADSVGMVQEIDLCIVEKVLKSLVNDRETRGNTRYFVNLARISVLDPGFHQRLQAMLSDASFDRYRLVFEIAEATAMSNIELSKKLFTLLKEIGCGCALDNFGTGFSSMYYLKQFDVDFLKIDGSLVRELPDDEASRLFVRALCDITRGLGKEVIAEKVESPKVLAELQMLGIEYAQGYYIGRPSPFITLEGSARIVDENDAELTRDLPPATKDTVEP